MNHLSKQTSPYLLQHSANPVDWYPWGNEALERARREDKPILVSIGYATCHWCHVMERESFEDEATAALMNERFVCIKVDREERPDVDQIYMEACQAISGGGGWPLNAFLLPDARPFYAGTYYPPERRYNRPAWRELLVHLSDLYRNDRGTVEEQAARLTQSIAGGSDQLLSVARPEGKDDPLPAMMEQLRGAYDTARGGFGGAPKFPQTQALELLLAYGVAAGNNQDVYLARHGLLSMLDGGIYDQLAGGFSRYTVDAAWRVPHFEKMLYDNALLLRLLARGQMVTPDERFRMAIEETTDWLETEMALPDGGYRAALDADSEGVEGKYYVWQREELAALLPPGDVDFVADFYGITEAGNWEEERTNILYRPRPLAAVAAAHDLPADVARDKLTAARRTLAEARRLRVPPGADDKLILQWNALLISGWCGCYRATTNPRYRQLATALFSHLTRHLRSGAQYHRNLTNNRLGAPAFLDDYAALLTAALDLHEVTQDLSYLTDHARPLAEYVLAHFSDEDDTLFYLRPPAGSELPVASRDLYDNALPSGNSQLCAALYRLGRIFDNDRYLSRRRRMLDAMQGAVGRYPTSFAGWGMQMLLTHHPALERELVVTGQGARAAAGAFLSDYRPGLLIVAAEEAHDDVGLLAGRYLSGLRYFVCQNRSCKLPVDSEVAARQLLDQT